jgi:uncharacterized protein (TIGR02996 family)
MSVTFVYRSHYDNPGCKHVRRFETDTVLDWFRSIWKPFRAAPDHAADQADFYAEKLIGRDVYSFPSLFEKIAEHGWPPPRTMRELVGRLEEALYVGEMKSGPHHVQVLTDDDELEMAIYVFDDHYAEKHPERVTFLVREDWRLPDGAADGSFKPPKAPKVRKLVSGEGCTYFAHLAAYDSGSLTDLPEFGQHGRVDGVRVPDFPRYLFAMEPLARTEAGREELNGELLQLFDGLTRFADKARGDEKAFLTGLRARPDDRAAWSAYSDWLEERGRGPGDVLRQTLIGYKPEAGCSQDARKPRKDQALVQGHVAQACKHIDHWDFAGDVYHHLILFDDLWAAAHPDLATSILRFASRWDVL